ncbi:MAG: hypothetical protein KGO96_07345 [Elusimicrobia bacterium]|nr:hypothetical protein [Elusimicrobiota bacterium]
MDAFLNAIQASSDPQIQGSPNLIYLLKTNVSTKATYTIADAGLGNYAVVSDKSWGALGNAIYGYVNANTSEVAPTETFTLVPSEASSATLSFRVNGGAVQTVTMPAGASAVPTITGAAGLDLIFTSNPGTSNSLNNVNSGEFNTNNGGGGLLATGGVSRGILSGIAATADLALGVSGSVATFTLSNGPTSWGNTPSVGDVLFMPSTSVLADTGNNNGFYLVTAATALTITATKISIAGTLTAVAAVAITATASSYIECFSPVTIQAVSGADRGAITGLASGTTLAGSAVSGQSITLTLSTSWAVQPQPGDWLLIPSTAPAGWNTANYGVYSVTSSTSTTAIVSRVSNGAPVAFSATALGATGASSLLQVLRPYINGVGKSVEIFDGAGAVNINTELLQGTGASATSAVSWISTSSSPQIITSGTEYSATLSLNRKSDNKTDTLTGGGTVALLVGYNGTTASLTIGITSGAPSLSTTVTGGSGASIAAFNPLAIGLNTLSDLASWLNSQPGYSAAVATALVGQLPIAVQNSLNNVYEWRLDQGTYNICNSEGVSQPGRIKNDAYSFFTAVAQNSTLCLLSAVGGNNNIPAQPTTGLPDVTPSVVGGTSAVPTTTVPSLSFYLAGGAKGGTTNSNVTGAIDACQKITGNFLVTLFSQNATLDATSGLTDSSSTYTVDSINAYAKSHVLLMSTIKQKGNRQAFCSKRDTFANVKLAANNLASARVSLCFQDFKQVNSQGSIVQFQPWMGAVLAAGMQAAGFYKAIFNKLVNTSGVLQNSAGPNTPPDFSDQSTGNVTDALNNGLLVCQRSSTGGFKFVSDQTTYGVDSNFVYNSIQAVYAADVVALTTAQRVQNAFVGQSLADVSAAIMSSFISGVLADMKRLKLIAASSDAPAGYKGLSVSISGPVALVSVNIKLATARILNPN